MATTFYNKATLTYNGVTAVSNTVTGELADSLTVTKTALTDEYAAGSEKTYVISLANVGATELTGLTVTDDLGAYHFGEGERTPLTYVDGSAKLFVGGAPQAVTATAGPPLVFTGVSVPAGGSATLVYAAETNVYTPLGAGESVTNSVTVTGGTLAAPVTASATISAADEPVLTIIKSLDPEVVTANGRLTYTFTISNTGSAADATDNVAVSDAFDPVLTSLTVTLNGVPMPAAGYSYNAATGVFTTTPGAITVPGATYTQDAYTGAWTTTPGTAVLAVTGTI